MVKIKSILLFITLAVPKAGAKIGGFPLYVSLISNFYFMLSGVGYVIRRKRELIISVFPILILFVLFLFNQFSFTGDNYLGSSYLNTASIIAYVSSILSFFCYYGALRIKNPDEWKKWLSFVFYILIIYAFMQKIFGDYHVVIPGITANYQDAVTPDFLAGKNNMIWGIGYLKATATYQNGNLFGANLLLIGFSVIANCKSDNRKVLLPLSLLCIVVLLTASVSIYIGLIAALLWMFLTSKNRSPSSMIIFMVGLIALSIISFIVFTTDNIFAQIIQERLFNRDITQGSGRIEKISEYLSLVSENPWVLVNGMLLFNTKFDEVYEILPVAILQILGLPMLLFFIYFVIAKLKNIFNSVYILPFIAYFAASLSDGAFWLPPTATNLFILMGLCTLWYKSSKIS
jgi:hypothetical protein